MRELCPRIEGDGCSMVREKALYVCRECGYETHRWMGRCPSCQNWNSIEEERIPKVADKNLSWFREAGEIKQLNEVDLVGEERFSTGISEFDRVLGGGVVPGSAVLVGGDPGIGKSTLLLQAALKMASRGLKVQYVTGEESLKQVKMRSERLGLSQAPLVVQAETEYSRIASQLTRFNPQVVVIDSIQTIMKGELGSLPGSPVQLREVTASLIQLAKSRGIIFFIVGHVTKEGILAGPRLLEHMVDCVLYFEGERYQSFRVLRSVKNRFGSTNEMGVFTMETRGLVEVKNPSAYFLSQRPAGVAGSVVVPTMEGSRPLLVELQALATPCYHGGNPRRAFTGVDYNRVTLIIAVLEKRLGLMLYSSDIFVNAVGGVKVMEPAADLGVALSIVSSYRDKPLAPHTMVFGEIGLTGEIRPVSRVEERLREGIKLGFSRCIMPGDNFQIKSGEIEKSLEMIKVSNLAQALNYALA